MSALGLAWAYLKDRAGTTALNILLLALGVATIVALLLFANQFDKRLQRDLAGIDMVVGAKGSPMQLILSSVFHADTPTGNISLAEAQSIRDNPLVERAIPLGLGDNFRGYRIVGTETALVGLYGARPAQGRLWTERKAFEAVVGADVAKRLGMQVGTQFVGSHGLTDGGHVHAEQTYTVVGILAPTGAVVDRLILTAMESVWQAHAEHATHDHDHEGEAHDHGKEEHDHGHDHGHDHTDHGHDHDHDHDHAKPATETGLLDDSARDVSQEVTALLVSYKSPLAAVRLPMSINRNTNMQSAVPALEAARLFNLIGIGLDTLRGFALLLILTSALGIFVALTSSLAQREGDIAMLRTMGATRGRVFGQILLEGVLLAAIGALLGLLIGHGALELAARLIPGAADAGLTGLTWVPGEALVVLGALALGAISALIPAIRAYRSDIAATLAKAA
jgi:putative ABC transport system permease protein